MMRDERLDKKCAHTRAATPKGKRAGTRRGSLDAGRRLQHNDCRACGLATACANAHVSQENFALLLIVAILLLQ